MTGMIADLQRREARLETRELVRLVDEMVKMATTAAHRVSRRQREEVDQWIAKAERLRPGARSAKPPSVSSEPVGERRPGGGSAGLSASDRRRSVMAAEPQVEPAAGACPAGGRAGGPGQMRLSLAELAKAVAAVRRGLERAAREQAVISWSVLRRQLGGSVPVLGPDDRLAVLLEVEKDTSANEPMLSSLLAAGGTGALALYRDLSRCLGRDLPSDDAAVRAHWQREILRLQHRYWRR